jgi:hypothetical protein
LDDDVSPLDREQLLRGKEWRGVWVDIPDEANVECTAQAVVDWLRNNPEWFEQRYGVGDVGLKLEDEPEVEPDDGKPGVRNVRFDVETITFSFGVSGVRAQSSRFDEHDRRNLIRLVGDLTVGTQPGGHVGRVINRLQRKIDAEGTPENEKKELTALMAEIRRQTDIVRDEFTSGRYKDEMTGDPYRMPRHITQLVNLSSRGLAATGEHQVHMSVSQNCRNNVDGGGMSDVEHKAQVIMDDMGARTRPNEPLSEQDRIILNTVLTSSGQVEMQEMSTGMTGSKPTRGIRDRSGDPGAMRYTEGLMQVKV